MIAPVTWLIVWLICPGMPLNRFGRFTPGLDEPLLGVPPVDEPVAVLPEPPEELEPEPLLLAPPPLPPPAGFAEGPDLLPDELEDPPVLPLPLPL